MERRSQIGDGAGTSEIGTSRTRPDGSVARSSSGPLHLAARPSALMPSCPTQRERLTITRPHACFGRTPSAPADDRITLARAGRCGSASVAGHQTSGSSIAGVAKMRRRRLLLGGRDTVLFVVPAHGLICTKDAVSSRPLVALGARQERLRSHTSLFPRSSGLRWWQPASAAPALGARRLI
jgi:hypothetical protein